MAPRAPWSLRMCVHELMVVELYSSHVVGRFSHNSSCGACRPPLGKPLGSFLIFRHVASSLESMVGMVAEESDIRQCVCMVLELAPYRRRRYFRPGLRGVVWAALLMVDMVSIVHLTCAFWDREAVRAVPRYPPGSESSCDINDMGVCPTRILARRGWSVELRTFLRFRDWSWYM